MNKRLFLLILYFVPLTIYGQEQWTLKKCIEYGLKNNRNTAIYENEKRAADAKAKEALAAYLPSVSLTGTLDDNLKVQETIIPAGVFGPTDTRIAFSKKFNTNATAQLDQTIFDKSLLTGLKANKYNYQQSELNQQKSQETIIYNISTAYYQIFVYREQLNLLKANQETYRQQMAISELQVKKGVTLQKDLDKITVDFNNSVSQIRVAESDITLAENQLKYEMGYEINGLLPLEDLPEENSTATAALTLNSMSFSAAALTDYQLSQVNTKLLEIDHKRIQAGIYPKITAYARYGAVGFGDNLGPAFKELSPFSAVGLKLNIPIFDFFKRNAQSNQAKYKYLNAIENLKIDDGKYQLDFENAKTKLIKAQSNTGNDKRNITLAQSVFNTTNLQYQKGVTDLTDWLTAQNSLKEAQNSYLSSLYSLYQARIEMEKAGGTLRLFYTSL